MIELAAIRKFVNSFNIPVYIDTLNESLNEAVFMEVATLNNYREENAFNSDYVDINLYVDKNEGLNTLDENINIIRENLKGKIIDGKKTVTNIEVLRLKNIKNYYVTAIRFYYEEVE